MRSQSLFFRIAFCTLSSVLSTCFSTWCYAEAPSRSITNFFAKHCNDCHQGWEAEAGIRLEQLSAPNMNHEQLVTWGKVVDVLEFREMPPQENPQPSAETIKSIVDEIHQALEKSVPTPPPALRRLNRQEYENTVHDLLGIDVSLADLLPEDGSVQGFDNVADGLSISSVLMEQYLEAADVAFEATIRRIKPLPAETRRADLMSIKENIDSVKKKKGGTIAVGESFVKFRPGWPPARVDDAHPIEQGVYNCRVAVWPHDAVERTLSVALYVGSLFGPEARKHIGNFDVTGTEDKPRVVEFTTRMEEGDTIHIVPRIWPEHITYRDKHEPQPGIGIPWVEIHGPIDQEFPTAAQKQLFGDVKHITLVEEWPIWMRHRKNVKNHIVESTKPAEDIERILRTLIPKAFRRPVSEEEMSPFIALALTKLEEGRTFEQAVRAGVTAVLCAPQFLLLNSEPVVDNYTIASRLSYFLWSTMPDEQLLQRAHEGTLTDAKVLNDEVERMLADPKVENFVLNFTGQWLELRDIEFTTPDKKLYPEFDPLLQDAMLKETRLFFAHLLEEDLSVMNFVDADFSFLNERLAQHYGIEGIKGHEEFRKFIIPEESIRGGVLTQASLLKVTANGTNTSPVMRGTWVLDNLLGRPAPPPPAGVPAVEPDIRGATTIRAQLDQHRNIDACASCHKRIDPPGFALETFDPIGGERDWYRSLGEGEKLPGKKRYRKGLSVESHGKFADGRAFQNFKQFRSELFKNEDAVSRGIATKLLVYGTGRALTRAQRPAVDEIVAEPTQHNLGLRSMIHAVVSSELFLHP